MNLQYQSLNAAENSVFITALNQVLQIKEMWCKVNQAN